MRNREEVESCLSMNVVVPRCDHAEHDSYALATIMGNQGVIAEILLDIRDLLAAKGTTP